VVEVFKESPEYMVKKAYQQEPLRLKEQSCDPRHGLSEECCIVMCC
jgi:hypothetical protein